MASKRKTTGALAAGDERRQQTAAQPLEETVDFDRADERPALEPEGEVLFSGLVQGKHARLVRDGSGKVWVCGFGEPYQTVNPDAMKSLLEAQSRSEV